MADPDRRRWLLFAAGACCFALAYGLIWAFSGRWRADPTDNVAGDILRVGGPSPTVASKAFFPEPSGAAERVVPTPEKWAVYLTGEVRRPGVVWVLPGSRVFQAVEAAGGLTGRADPVAVNLAARLSDGAHLHVPARGERGGGGSGTVSAPGSPGTAGGGGAEPPSAGTRPEEGEAPTDLNAATAAQLEALPGIGPKTAEAILRYRQENGPFRSVEELLRVKGICPKKLEALRGRVTVGP